MTLKTTNIRKQYFVPYAEMIECEEKECLLDTVSGFGEDPISGGGNEEFAKIRNRLSKKAVLKRGK